MKLSIEYLSVDNLTQYNKNAREHRDADISAIVKSIQEFGFDDPIGIWSDQNVIVEGHGRLLAAKKLGMKTVPCIRLDHLSDEQRRAYALAHNKTAELSSWDFDLLKSELLDIKGIDMSDFGFDLDFEDLLEEEKEENPVDVLPESKIYMFAISAFGVKSECLIQSKLSDVEAEHLLSRLEKISVMDVSDKIREALNDI